MESKWDATHWLLLVIIVVLGLCLVGAISNAYWLRAHCIIDMSPVTQLDVNLD